MYFFAPLDSNLFWLSHPSLGGYVFFFDPLDSTLIR